MLKRVLSLLLSLLLALSGLLPGLAGAEEEKVLTLMVYITGSDLESAAGLATVDITEMMRSGVDPDKVNIVLMTGGSNRWWGGFPSDKLCIYTLAKNRPQLVQELDSASMGSADTLSYFLNYSHANYPAGQYALILWDHGGGPMVGVCFDELYQEDGADDSLSVMELKQALEASPFGAGEKLEWIGFDACLMSAVETAHICAPFANFMIASQETEPGSGWDYKFLSTIAESTSGAETGWQIVQNYFAAAGETDDALTLACIDLSMIDEVEAAMNALFGQLDEIISPESFSELSNRRMNARSIGRASTGSDYDLVDLYHLAQQYASVAPEQAQALCDAVYSAVVCHGSNMDDMNGLSVYYPYYNKLYYLLAWKDTYASLGFSEAYVSYMDDYAEIWMGEQLSDWSGLRSAALPQADDGTQTLTMELTEEQQANFASAQLVVLDEFPSGGGYYDIYTTDDVELENGVLSAQYAYDALYVLDENGRPLSDALPYIVVEDKYLVRAALSENSPAEDFWAWLDGEIEQVWLQCTPDEETGDLNITGLIALPEEEGVLTYPSLETVLHFGKQSESLDPDLWPNIVFMRHPRVPAQDDAGNTEPYTAWLYPEQIDEAGLLMEYYDIDNTAGWSLGFRRQQFAGRDLQAQLIVTDTQGRQYAGDLMPIRNEHASGAVELSASAADEQISITIDSAQTVASALDAGLYLYGTVENLGGEPLSLTAQEFIADNTVLMYSESSFAASYSALQTGGAQPIHFHIPAQVLSCLKDNTIENLRFTLTAMNEELEIVGTIPVEISAEIDLSGVVEPQDAPAALANASLGGAEYELLSLSETAEGLGALVHVTNASEEPVRIALSAADALVNGCLLSGAVRTQDLSLPAGCDAYLELTLSRTTPASLLWETELPVVDGFDFWNIGAVESIALSVGGEWLRFELAEPLPLAETAAAGHTTLAQQGGVEITLHSAAIENGSLTLELGLRADGESSAKVSVASVKIDGADAAFTICDEESVLSFGAWEIEPGTAVRGGVKAPAEAASEIEIAFDIDGAVTEPALIGIEAE